MTEVLIKSKNLGILTTRLDGKVMELVREMPGRKKWLGRSVHFEPTAMNVEYLKTHFPDADWKDDAGRVSEIEKVQELARDSSRRKTNVLPAEAANFPFKSKPYDHQLRAFLWAREREFFALFMEMGCGKTKSALDVLAYQWATGAIEGCLLVAPNGVHRQWVNEQIPKHMPAMVELEPYVYTSGKRVPGRMFERTEKFRLLAMNVEALSHKSGLEVAQHFANTGRMAMGVDESTAIKTPGAKRTANVLKLAKMMRPRFILCGAPITKGIEDIYSQFKFLHEDALGFSSFYTFRNRYCEVAPAYHGAPQGVVKIIGYKNQEELIRKIDAHCFRVTKAECFDLPPKIYMEREVELTKEQHEYYEQLKTELYIQIDRKLLTANNALTKLLRLQQIVCGFYPDDDGKIHEIPSNRVQAVLDIFNEMSGKTAVWARFRHDIDRICAALTKAGIKHVRYDGAVSSDDREKAKQQFIEDPDTHWVSNPAVGGRGIDGIQIVRNAVYFSNSFDADHRWQSEDRFHRAGMGEAVTYIDLVAPGTVDRKMLRALRDRKNIADVVLDKEFLQ